MAAAKLISPYLRIAVGSSKISIAARWFTEKKLADKIIVITQMENRRESATYTQLLSHGSGEIRISLFVVITSFFSIWPIPNATNPSSIDSLKPECHCDTNGKANNISQIRKKTI